VRRAAVVGAVALAVGATVFLMTRGQSRPQPLNISYADIAKVQAYPVPEGTPPPPLLRSVEVGTYARPLTEVRSDIPSPFPAPVRCDYSGFGDGLQLSVWLRNGRHLDYFACAFPEELKSVYEHAWWPH
jgi:hypothetical protein